MSGRAPIRVLVADDHPLVRQGVTAVLASQADIEVVGEADDGRQAVELFGRLRPDVAIIDLGLPVMDGVAAMKAISAGLTELEIEVLRLMAKGCRNAEIAHALQITRGTAKWFVSSILGKLGADDRTEAVTTALERGILHH